MILKPNKLSQYPSSIRHQDNFGIFFLLYRKKTQIARSGILPCNSNSPPKDLMS